MKILITVLSILLVIFFLFSLLWLKPEDNPSNYSSNLVKEQKDIDEKVIDNTENDFLMNNESYTESENIISERKFYPKTEWSEKNIKINGINITYKFGEGNPPEVSLSPDKYLPNDEKDGIPYVTAKAEHQLKDFLSDDNLPELLNRCVNFLDKQMRLQNPTIPANNLPSILDNRDVDMENYLIIDEETGRKMINQDIDSRMNDFLNIMNNPLDSSPLAMTCFGLNRMQDFEVLQKKFHDLGREYMNTGKGIKSSEWIDLEKSQK